MLEFYKSEQRKARKNYMCDVCGRPILRGRDYIYASQKYDREIQTSHRHIHCDALLDAFFASDRYDGVKYSIDKVLDWLFDLCNELYRQRKCSDKDYYEKCDMERCCECPLIFEKALKPEIRRAAEQSVRDNARREDID